MNNTTLRTMYVIGIALNLLALGYAAIDGAYLFAATFGFITVYLAIRYWMVATNRYG